MERIAANSSRGCLPLEWALAFFGELLVNLLDHRLKVDLVHMAAQLGLDVPRMDRRGANATRPMPMVKSHRKQDVRGLGAARGNPRMVLCPLKVGILQIDVGEAVTGRRQIDETPFCADQRRVVAPMPSGRMAVSAKPGLFTNWRKAKRKS